MAKLFKGFSFLSFLILAGFLFCFSSWSSGGEQKASAADKASKSPLRPTDLIEKPGHYLNRSVEVDIVEPLDGPVTPEALASLEYGQVRVRVPDAKVPGEISLVPEAFHPQDPNRYRRKFDRVIEGPIRVRGEFLRDEEMTKALHNRPVYVIRASSIEPLALEPPKRVSSLAELESNRAFWNRKQIVYEGVYESRFEVSALDKAIWLSSEYRAKIVGEPASTPGEKRIHRVRVTGILFAAPNARYGHLGGYGLELLASKIEYLGAP